MIQPVGRMSRRRNQPLRDQMADYAALIRPTCFLYGSKDNFWKFCGFIGNSGHT